MSLLKALTNKTNTILIPVFLPAVAVIVLMVIGTISNPELANQLFQKTLIYITEQFGWFYMLSVTLFLIFIVSIAFSSWGHIKLGPDHATPEYSSWAWFAMLFSAGYGIALLFFGVAEPVIHYAEPPTAIPESIDAAEQAMQITYFHWGFHIWAIYGLVGLTLAYFSFRHGLPLSMRSTLYPLIGNKIYGPIGHIVDVFAIFGTLFGLATSLGLSVSQINAGLHYLWPSIPTSTTVQITAIALITTMATLSIIAGMDKGIKNLSLINMTLAIILMLFVFIVGPTLFILNTLLQNTGSYLSHIVERTFDLQAYSGSGWINNWTLFIFGWTIAWSPFVGLFIAKISRGRTIRQFVFGVMLAPTFFTFMWFSVFGDTALHLIMHEGYTTLITEVQNDKAIALFKLFEQLPFTSFVSFVAVCLIITFFVTSSDSGSLVVDSLASGGIINTPVWQRVFWASTEGVVASVLLLAGGLGALQTASVVSALPFAIIMLIAGVGLWRALIIEGHREKSLSSLLTSNNNITSTPWRDRLSSLSRYPDKQAVADFIYRTVYDAMLSVAKELEAQHWPCKVIFDQKSWRVSLSIEKQGQLDFIYEVRLRKRKKPSYLSQTDNHNSGLFYYRAEVFLRRGGQTYNIYGFNQEKIINDIISQFEKYLHFIHLSPGILPWKMELHDDELQSPFSPDTPFIDTDAPK